jgi:hypothetical protein
MSRKPILWLDRALFVSPYYYRLCLTEKDYHKELKRLKLPKKDWDDFLKTDHCGATIHLFIEPKGGRCAVVCLHVDKKHTIEQVHAMLVHEAVHLWQEIRDYIGEGRPSTEFEAYAIQSLSQRLMESYAEQTSKKARK